ncbi:MAG: hypothetical protein AB7S26_33695 [Sandaracinaceae bacterium]
MSNDAMSGAELLDRVVDLVRQVTEARFEGGEYAKLARAHGYADGYMRALLDAGLADRDTLIAAVGQARREVVESGSGTREAA